MIYAGCMRYPDSGGLSAVGRARREMVRLRAARMFEQDVRPVQVAHDLRVSTKSAYQWRRRWGAGGLGLGRGPALDAGPGHRADRVAVPRALYAARHLVFAAPHGFQPAGAGAPGRGAG